MDRRHRREGVGMGLDMGGWLSFEDFIYWWMCSADARNHCGRNGGGCLHRVDEEGWRRYRPEGPADTTNILVLMVRDSQNDQFKLRLHNCCEFDGPLPSEDERKGINWDGRLPRRVAGIRVILNQACAPWQPVDSIAYPLTYGVIEIMSCCAIALSHILFQVS